MKLNKTTLKNTITKTIYPVLVISLGIVGCSSPPPPTITKEMMLPAVIAGTTIPENEIDSVRFGESVKAYTVGRYIDPNNPDVMHEKNIIYRLEENCSWNTMPNEPFSLPFRQYESNRQKMINIQRPLTSELEAEIGRQKQLREKLQENNQAIHNTLGISRKTNQDVENVVNTSLALSAKMKQLEEFVLNMKRREKKNLLLIKQLLDAQKLLSQKLHQEVQRNLNQQFQRPVKPEQLDFDLGFQTKPDPRKIKKMKKPIFGKPSTLEEK